MRNTKRFWLLGASSLTILSLLGAAFVLRVGGTHAAVGASGTITHLVYSGQTSLSSVTGDTADISTGLSNDQVAPESGDNTQFPRSGNGAIRVPADHAPQPSPSGVSGDNSAVVAGFSGLNHFNERTAGTGSYAGTQFSLEPPDQGLCVGGGYVIEAVNDALRVFNTAGTPQTSTIALNQFYGLAPAINRHTHVRGAFVSDPKCYYDAPTHGWFVTVLVAGQSPQGDLVGPLFTDIAVTTAANPATASWNLYQLYATDDGTNGTPVHQNCPCLGDQPLIGADANGFYVSTNEFGLASGFNGAQIYAMSKTGLENNTVTSVVHIDAGETMSTPDTGGIWYSVQPATTPGNGYASDTEYFLSALQFFSNAPLDNRIAVWALTGTSTLNSSSPSVHLTNTVISSEVYGQPPDSAQKPGSNPLGAVVAPLEGFGKPGNNPAQPENFLNSNDDRMNQVVYANGMLFSGVNTVVASNGASRTGIAYFVVTPSVSGGQVSGTMTNQGYVSLQFDSVMFPSIGVNPAGKGVMTFTVAGPDYYPSSGYATLDATNGASAVHVSGAGVGPEDGFTGYYPFSGDRVSRWGDYSAAVADEQGNVWMASEYIGQSCTLAQFEADTTCGHTRTILANWGTYVTAVNPS